MPTDKIKAAIRVYERASGGGSWDEIDYGETGFFVEKAENLRLEVVFVLDYTNSMTRARLRDGRSPGEAMMGAFESAVRALPGSHRIGVVEFHDRNVEPGVLSPLTTDVDSVLASVRQFEQSGFERGSSRLWDGVVTGLDLFSHDPTAVRALVFLSDGHDTSSVKNLEQAADYASDRKVQLYAAGVGVVHQEERLKRAVASSGGGYYPARDLGGLEDLLGTIVSSLRGHYKVSYVTLRRTGQYKTGLGVALRGTEAWLETDSFDVARFFGPDNQGVVQFDAPSLDRFSGRATFFMRGRHVPRNINRIRFRLDTTAPISVEPVAAADGGLLDGWVLSGPDYAGWFEASSDRPLLFGSSGLLLKVTLSNIDDWGIWVPVAFDNSIYAGGKEFSRPIRVRVGSLPRIVFASFRHGNYEIYVMNTDGSGQVRLTDDPGNDNRPNWSPDGRHIVFHSNRAGYWQIYVMNADGSDQRSLTSGTHPSWSPDGRRIAFVSDGELYVISADGSGRTRLTYDSVSDYDPDWSPDGRRIAFHSKNGDIRAVHIVNADGSGRRSLADARDANWSGDGRRIVFDSNRAGYWEIYVMNVDGSDRRLLRSGIHPNWSNGGRIAFSWNDDIYVMNDDGSGLIRLTENPGSDYAPSWSPDG